jgi:glucarate dehydratase
MSASSIAELRVTPVAVGDPPLRNSAGVHEPYFRRLVLELVAEDGTTGLAETLGEPEVLRLLDGAREALRHANPFDLEDLLRRARLPAAVSTRATPSDGAGVPAPGTFAGSAAAKAAAAIEAAALDLQSRLLGIPLATLLGGSRRSEVEFAGYLFYKFERHADAEASADEWGAIDDPSSLVRSARRMVDRFGFRSLKLKGGVFAPEAEIEGLRALRAAFPGHALRIDPNAAWTVETSVRVGAQLADVVEYLEDPTPGHAGMAEVGRRLATPLATNMVVTSFADLPEAVRTGSVDIVLADHHYWGGLRATQHLATLCATFGLGLSMHSNSHLGISLATMVHVASTLPEGLYACDTHVPWLGEDVVTRPLELVDGAVRVPDAPGLGVELDREALGVLHERYLSNAGRRDDVGYMRRFVPDWEDRRPRW